MSVVYDAGALIAADRGDRRMWADHRARLELGLVPITTAPAVAQVSRAPRQTQLHRLLRGCLVESFDAAHATGVGELLAKAGSSDVLDAHVVLIAVRAHATVLTSDPDDLQRLSDALPERVGIRVV